MTGSADPRGRALARFLRQRAEAFSLSSDVTGSEHTAHAGMALLDAALKAENLGSDDPLLNRMSEVGLFELQPNGDEKVVESADLHRVVQRPISGRSQDADHILGALLAALTSRP